MSRSPEIPRASSLPDVIKEMRRPHTETDTGFIVIGTWIAEGDPGNDPGTDELSPPFLNGWTNKTGFRSGFRTNEIGEYELALAIKDGTIGLPVFILPEDFRRDYDVRILQATNIARTIHKVWVKSNGEVIIEEEILIP